MKAKTLPFVVSIEPAPRVGNSGGLLDVTGRLAAAYIAQLPRITPAHLMPQNAMAAAADFERIAKAAAMANKTFDDLALKHREAGGTFAQGAVAINFPDNGRRTPAWKDEAIRLAGELAALKKEAFSPEAYEQSVIDATPRKTSIGVDLVVSETGPKAAA